MSRVFLDAALSRPVPAPVMDLVRAAMDRGWADPDAGYHEGRQAAALLQQASSQTQQRLGGSALSWAPDTTSAVRIAVQHLASRPGVRMVATTAVDRQVIQQEVRSTALPSTVLPVAGSGALRIEELRHLTTPAVLAIQVGNQEIGTLQPVSEVLRWAHGNGSFVILDTSAALGWVAVPEGWNALITAPRAWGAVPGAVPTAWSTGTAPPAPGEVNVPAAVCCAVALDLWLAQAPQARAVAAEQTAHLRSLLTAVPDLVAHGDPTGSLPHILSLSALYVDGEALQTHLDRRGFAVGSGSACASDSGQPSHVLAAIGALTSGNIRIGLPPGIGADDLTRFAAEVGRAITEIRRALGGEGL